MALVNVISKELEADLRAAVQEITRAAAQAARSLKAAETLLKNLDGDRQQLMATVDRVTKALEKPQ